MATQQQIDRANALTGEFALMRNKFIEAELNGSSETIQQYTTELNKWLDDHTEEIKELAVAGCWEYT